ncbi:MAG: DUF4388 domain-containing protein [Desulfurobacteriaceae bacterium]
MELKGGFKSTSEILDLLQIVALGRKEGKVNFKTEEGRITVYFKDGKFVNFESAIPLFEKLRNKVVNKEVDIFDAAKVILHFLSLQDEGEFHFIEESINVEEIGSGDTMNIMMDFTKEVDEMPPKLKDILKNNLSFTLSESLESKEVCFRKEDWKIFVEAVKGKSSRDIVFLNFPLQDSINVLSNLLNQGIISPASSGEEKTIVSSNKENIAGQYVSPEKMEKIRSILLEVMGPMGEFLIDETMDELGISEISVSQVQKFVDILVSKIPESCFINGESCRERFKEDFTKILLGGD